MRVGATVLLHGLVARPDLNGTRGTVVKAADPKSGRFGVRLHEGGSTIALKPDNLTDTAAEVTQVLARQQPLMGSSGDPPPPPPCPPSVYIHFRRASNGEVVGPPLYMPLGTTAAQLWQTLDYFGAQPFAGVETDAAFRVGGCTVASTLQEAAARAKVWTERTVDVVFEDRPVEDRPKEPEPADEPMELEPPPCKPPEKPETSDAAAVPRPQPAPVPEMTKQKKISVPPASEWPKVPPGNEWNEALKQAAHPDSQMAKSARQTLEALEQIDTISDKEFRERCLTPGGANKFPNGTIHSIIPGGGPHDGLWDVDVDTPLQEQMRKVSCMSLC